MWQQVLPAPVVLATNFCAARWLIILLQCKSDMLDFRSRVASEVSMGDCSEGVASRCILDHALESNLPRLAGRNGQRKLCGPMVDEQCLSGLSGERRQET